MKITPAIINKIPILLELNDFNHSELSENDHILAHRK